MKSSAEITIELSPIVERDNETGMFVARFADIPAVAYDETEEKAVLRLISVFEVVLQEQKELVFDRLIKKEIEKAVREDQFQILTINRHNERQKMKLQLIS
jgi:predicted RNase H-like HicB family nuclease